MRGLLSAGPVSAGLLQLDPRLLQAMGTRQPQRADADDERMFAQSGNGYTEDGRALSGLLSATPQQAQRQAAAPQAPAPRQRGRANGWRVLDSFLFGDGTLGESLDGERARQQRLADEPAERERLARLSSLAQGMGPMAELAFATNRDEFGKAMASNLEGYTLSAGGVRGGALGPVAAAPTTSVVNDQIFRNDPMTGTSTAIARADPSHANLTARINATNPVSLAPGARLVDPYTGEERAQGAARVFSAADGAQLYDEQGTKIAENEKDRDPNAPSGPRITEGQAKDGFNAGRMTGSSAIINELEGNGFDYGLSSLTGGQMRESGRRYQAAALEWADSLLRMTTGAAATRDEIDNTFKSYFPQPGDSQAVRQQKASMRAQAEEAAVRRAGPGYQRGDNATAAPVRVNTPAEARALPSGTVFIGPDGQRRRVP